MYLYIKVIEIKRQNLGVCKQNLYFLIHIYILLHLRINSNIFYQIYCFANSHEKIQKYSTIALRKMF